MEITETTALLRLGVSLVLGAAIGLERDYHRHPAGLRTFTLITVSSTLA
ncbi:MAG: MgtC/SapB family protein, partial [Bacteroidales bacterium]|nr:MgtC/SapB family protein [Bacteroidales bacterium]